MEGNIKRILDTNIYHNSVSLYNAHSYMFQHLYVILMDFYICASLSYIDS